MMMASTPACWTQGLAGMDIVMRRSFCTLAAVVIPSSPLTPWQDFGVLHHSGAPPLGAAAARLPSDAEQPSHGQEQPVASSAKPSDDADLRRASLAVEDHPLSSAPGSLWRRRFQDEEMLAQIRRDVLRTHPDLHFFSGRDEVGEERREVRPSRLGGAVGGRA